MAMGRVRIEEAAGANHSFRQMVKDVTDKVDQRRSHGFGNLLRFHDRPSNDVVVNGAVFPLLHQPQHLAFDHLAGVQRATCKHETIEIVAIGSGSIRDEPVRIRIRPRHRGDPSQDTALLVIVMLQSKPCGVFDEDVDRHVSTLRHARGRANRHEALLSALHGRAEARREMPRCGLVGGQIAVL